MIRWSFAGCTQIATRGTWIPALALLLALAFGVVGCGYYVTVERGDTLYSISQDYGVTVNDVLEANPSIKNADKIQVGEKIRIPREKSYKFSAADTRAKTPEKGTRTVDKTSHSNNPKPTPTPTKSVPDQTDRSTQPPPAVVSSDAPGRFIWPTKGSVLRKFGKGPDGRLNEGVDIAAPVGQKIVAAADGEVIMAGTPLQGYGNMVVVQHADQYVTIYAHNRVNLVKKGQKVKQGQAIAEVGDTGRASAPHLHFEVRYRLTTVDPLTVLPR